MNDKENIVKKVCKELGITQKELAERIGISEQSLRNAVSSGKLSNQTKKAIELFVENVKLKKELEKYKELGKLLKEIIN
ncbi:helix-turn-helix domain-containing protein [Deferribacter abyssi]|uniref:helix-turn-helix domain-containing protein n=1 Tax=Deferribacter abyssi TaxID=213806 RepID=UPI003C1A2F30